MMTEWGGGVESDRGAFASSQSRAAASRDSPVMNRVIKCILVSLAGQTEARSSEAD